MPGLPITEFWMLQVALFNGSIKSSYLRNVAKGIIHARLGSGDWDNPKGSFSQADLVQADDILAKISVVKTIIEKYDFKPIVWRFATNKKKVYLHFAGHYVELSAAPLDGNNPGSVYVKVDYNYIGKINPFGTLSPLATADPYKDDLMEALKAFALTCKHANPAEDVQEVKSPSGYTATVPATAFAAPQDAYLDVNEQMEKIIIHAINKHNQGGKW